MFLTRQTHPSKLTLSFSVFIFLICSIVEVSGQQTASGRPSMRDQAKAIQRAELDRLLLAATPARAESDSTRSAVMKQIREDFKELQELNNKMMATAWAGETLDYSFLSDMVSRIKGKAARLKTNLNLPGPAGPQETASEPKGATDPAVNSVKEFRNALLLLDQTIMRFVTNPLFQTPNTLEVNLATKARQDLEAVISLTAELKKTASRLRKTSDSQ